MKLTAKAETARRALPGDPGPAVILVRPQLGENVGQVARAMLNFGLSDLRLVRPRFGWPNAKAVAASAGAYEVLNRMRIFDDLAGAVADLHLVFATTARERGMDKPVVTAEEAARRMREAHASGLRTGWLFGPERTGLDNEEIARADAILTIPLNPAFSSLNLAQAVLLCVYEWFRSGDRTPPVQRAEPQDRPATRGELDAFLDWLIAELDASGFFRSPTRRESLLRSIETMFARFHPTVSELNLLFGISKHLARRGRRGAPEEAGETEPGEVPTRS